MKGDPAGEAIGRVIGIEGGYANDPKDSGGETIWGITARVARAYGYAGAMRDMPRDEAVRIYRARFWESNRLDEIFAMSPRIAEELFDTGVNLGTDRAATFLQRLLNVLNLGGSFYPETKVDGRVGPMTLAALREFLETRRRDGELVMLRGLNALQGAFYVQLTEAREKDERFVFGWLLNRVGDIA